jgi:hypothetical protein
MKESRGLGLNIAFTEGEQKIVDPEKRSVQRPRVFYRREMEASRWWWPNRDREAFAGWLHRSALSLMQ